MQSPETSCILIPGGPQNPQTAWKAAGKERIRVRGIPGGIEAGAHQAPPAPQTAPQRGLGADRSRVGARHLSPAPRPSKRIHNHPHQPRRVTRIPPPSRPKTRRRLPRKEPRPQRIQPPAITTRPPRPSPRTDRRSLPLHPPNQTDDPTPRPAPAQPLTSPHDRPRDQTPSPRTADNHCEPPITPHLPAIDGYRPAPSYPRDQCRLTARRRSSPANASSIIRQPSPATWHQSPVTRCRQQRGRDPVESAAVGSRRQQLRATTNYDYQYCQY